MKIRIDQHTLDRAQERGTNAEEIKEVLETGIPFKAERGRLGKTRVYDFNRKRLGTFYEQRRVEVIYAVEGDTLITVTAYVFYGKWEGQE